MNTDPFVCTTVYRTANSFSNKSVHNNCALWKQGKTIKIGFLSNIDRDRFMVNCRKWTDGTNLSVEVTDNLEESDVRVVWGQGNWSYVGESSFVAKNRPTLSLNSWTACLHEIGHMLGRSHEHKHSAYEYYDEVVIADMKRYGWSEAKTRHNITDDLPDGPCFIETKEPDIKSVMCYAQKPSWIKSGPIVTRANTILSEGDRIWVLETYPVKEPIKIIPEYPSTPIIENTYRMYHIYRIEKDNKLEGAQFINVDSPVPIFRTGDFYAVGDRAYVITFVIFRNISGLNAHFYTLKHDSEAQKALDEILKLEG